MPTQLKCLAVARPVPHNFLDSGRIELGELFKYQALVVSLVWN